MSSAVSTAMITGASRGLGASLAKRLARAGANIAIGARDRDQLAAVAAEIEETGGSVHFEALDVTDLSSIEGFLKATRARFGPVDTLVNNAGCGAYKPFTENDYDELVTTLRVNLEGTVLMSRAVIDEMLANGRGKILNIASDLSRKPLANMAAYVAAKHGVLGFAGSLAREVKDRGVRVMTLMPGIMDTHFNGPPGDREETWAMNPEHVAELALTMLTQPAYLMTDEVTVHPMHQEF